MSLAEDLRRKTVDLTDVHLNSTFPKSNILSKVLWLKSRPRVVSLELRRLVVEFQVSVLGFHG